MTDLERFETALVRVKSGESIRTIVTVFYKGNWRHYKRECTDSQRSQLIAARLDYKEQILNSSEKKARQYPPRFIVDTTPELFQAVANHCQQKGLTVSRFLNSAARDALNKVKS